MMDKAKKRTIAPVSDNLKGFELSRQILRDGNHSLGLSHPSFHRGRLFLISVMFDAAEQVSRINTFDYELTVDDAALMCVALQLASAIAADFDKYWEAR